MIGSSSVEGWLCCGIARSLEIAKVAIIEGGGVQVETEASDPLFYYYY